MHLLRAGWLLRWLRGAQADCPLVTNLYPVRPEDFPSDGRGDVCCACDEPFKIGDVYTYTTESDHWAATGRRPL